MEMGVVKDACSRRLWVVHRFPTQRSTRPSRTSSKHAFHGESCASSAGSVTWAGNG